MSSLTAGLLLMALQSVQAPAPPGHASAARLRRGPIESRDEFLPAQPQLTLPAVAPDALSRGRTRVRVAGDWGSDFGLRVGRIDRVRQLLYFVDGEHRSAALQVDHGLGDRWTVEARLAVLWRGGGSLDGLIDAWHRLTGLPDNDRPRYPRDQLSLTGFDAEDDAVTWTGPEGTGLGGVELGARWSTAPRDSGWTAAFESRVQLPTGTGAFADAGSQFGAQALAAGTLGSAGDAYFGMGATVTSRAEQGGLQYVSVRPQGFLALEWRPGRAVSLLAQLNAAGRLVRNLEEFPGLHLVLRMGAKVDVARGWRLEAGFTEGLKPVDATTDFGVLLGLERTF